VTVDIVLFVLGPKGLEIPLIRRRSDPFAGRWALPGGFVDEYEPLEVAARRELREETALRAGRLVQVGAYGDPKRDPRGHTVGVAFLTAALATSAHRALRAGDDAADVRFFSVNRLPPLAFDHGLITRDARRLFARLSREEGLVFDLLPPRFSTTDLARALAAVLPAPVAPRPLARKIAACRYLRRAGSSASPSALLRFDRAAFRRQAKRRLESPLP
jgi:8-oxo-dGTP diphosphatase